MHLLADSSSRTCRTVGSLVLHRKCDNLTASGMLWRLFTEPEWLRGVAARSVAYTSCFLLPAQSVQLGGHSQHQSGSAIPLRVQVPPEIMIPGPRIGAPSFGALSSVGAEGLYGLLSGRCFTLLFIYLFIFSLVGSDDIPIKPRKYIPLSQGLLNSLALVLP